MNLVVRPNIGVALPDNEHLGSEWLRNQALFIVGLLKKQPSTKTSCPTIVLKQQSIGKIRHDLTDSGELMSKAIPSVANASAADGKFLIPKT